ncbi:hypothetical protein LguiA_035516 [Lonicera macranthoides]
MEQSKNYNHVPYSSVEAENQEHGLASQGFPLDHTAHINANLRPADLKFSEVKPVLNFSIQTGEEFSLEFMRDRVNPRKPFIPHTSGDPSRTTGYSELKGILGISHTGSESGSDVSMVTIVEKNSKEFERKNSSLYENKSNYGSVTSVPRTSSDYTSNRAVFHSTSTKIKVLCSFGGKILPRPSDGKLRYVGGDTRIIRISKDISWQDLWRKTIEIYNQTHAIKYQLPGEDLDALVSVSCDEDLQNMMEECNVIGDEEGSKKLRMFLFSMSDLDDTHFGLADSGGNSEIQYVVAVNGMDMGSRRGSMLHGLASSSANNLDELDGQNVERDTRSAATEFVGTNTSPLTTFNVPSSTTQSSQAQPIHPSSSNAYETESQFYHRQMINQGEAKENPLQYGSESRPSVTQQGSLTEAHPSSALSVQDPPIQEREVKPKGSIQKVGDNEKMQSSRDDYLNSSRPYDGNMMDYTPVDEGKSKFPLNPQEHVKVSLPHDAVNRGEVPKSSDNELHTAISAPANEYANSESDLIDLGFLEPPVPPQRVFHSERIPRQQAELLNRFSKSDDSLGSQFLLTHSRSDTMQKDSITESVENLHNEGLDIQTEQLISNAKKSFTDPRSTDDELEKNENMEAVQDPVHEDVVNENQVLKDDPVEETTESGSQVKHHDDPARSLPEFHLGERAGSSSVSANNTQEQAQPPAWTGSSTRNEPSVSVSRSERGDILIDINDRFPSDFISDIFSKANFEDLSGVGPLQRDGAGLSMNIANHEPKRWSFFQKLAGDEFGKKDVSLMDQDHVDFSSELPKVEEEVSPAYKLTPLTKNGISSSQIDSQNNFGEVDKEELTGTTGVDSMALNSEYNPSQLNYSEGLHFDDLAENIRIPNSEYEDQIRTIGIPHLDPSLGDLDINSLQIIKNEDLEELRELGSGTFGTVYHGKWRGTDVAIKRIKKSCFAGRSSEQERLTIEFWREADILSKLHHPNVVAFYGVVQDGPGGTLATVAEYMVDGSLRHVLVRKDRQLDHRKRLIIAMDAAFGMEYLHSKNIVHFDLKCDNLLVNLKDPSRPICKVADFGLSKIKRNTLVSGGVRGTLPWMAPELLNGSSNKVSEKVDVFSFGIVLWEILTGEEPYANMHYGAIIGGIVNNTLRPNIPTNCDPEWRRLMEHCWAPNPVVRPTFTEITRRLRVMSAACHTKPQVHKATT